MMRPINLVLEQIQDTEDLINQSKKMIKQFPGDQALKLSLEQEEFLYNSLLEEYRTDFQSAKRHTFEIIINSPKISSIPVIVLTSVIDRFQNMLNKALKILQPKAGVNYDLLFEATIHGSIGFLLSTEVDSDMFSGDDHNAYDNTSNFVFDTISELSKAESDSEVLEVIMNNFNDKSDLLRIFGDFYESVVTTGYDVNINWNSPSGVKKSSNLGKDNAKKIYTHFNEEAGKEEKEVLLHIVIKGISLYSGKIEFYKLEEENTHRRKPLEAKYDNNLTEVLKTCLDEQVNARFFYISFTNPITKKLVKEKWHLINIQRT